MYGSELCEYVCACLPDLYICNVFWWANEKEILQIYFLA